VLILHKFGANASNLVLMPKKAGGGGHCNFFFLNHVLRMIGRTPGEPTGRTPSNIYIYEEKFTLLYEVSDIF
jgi:hypothetical protein